MQHVPYASRLEACGIWMLLQFSVQRIQTRTGSSVAEDREAEYTNHSSEAEHIIHILRQISPTPNALIVKSQEEQTY